MNVPKLYLFPFAPLCIPIILFCDKSNIGEPEELPYVVQR